MQYQVERFCIFRSYRAFVTESPVHNIAFCNLLQITRIFLFLQNLALRFHGEESTKTLMGIFLKDTYQLMKNKTFSEFVYNLNIWKV